MTPIAQQEIEYYWQPSLAGLATAWQQRCFTGYNRLNEQNYHPPEYQIKADLVTFEPPGLVASSVLLGSFGYHRLDTYFWWHLAEEYLLVLIGMAPGGCINWLLFIFLFMSLSIISGADTPQMPGSFGRYHGWIGD
jgi:hypothetical protein